MDVLKISKYVNTLKHTLCHVKSGKLAGHNPAAISCYSVAIQHSVFSLLSKDRVPHVSSLTCQAVLSCHTHQSLSCNPPIDVREVGVDPWLAVILQDSRCQMSV